MTNVVAIILGFIEGATEFIPVSSSGHLIIARKLLGTNLVGGLAFDAILQLATTLALLVYFWKDIANLIKIAYSWLMGDILMIKDKVMLKAIVFGTIPAVVFGVFLESKMDTVFRNIDLVAITLILGSILMFVAQRYAISHIDEEAPLTFGKGMMIGFFQCLALVPGISRSGATISGGLFAKLGKEEAVRFSFLLSIPILLGAGLKKLFEVRHELFGAGFGMPILVGSIVAFTTGLVAINFLIKYLKNHDLNIFIIYRIVLSLAILLLF